MRNPHWEGASLTDRILYAVGFCYGCAIVLALVLIVAWLEAPKITRKGFARCRALL